jgi:hypothetical protein
LKRNLDEDNVGFCAGDDCWLAGSRQRRPCWRKDSVKAGDTITVHGFGAKDGSHTVAARQIQTADGRKLFAGSPDDNGPKQ